MEHNRRKDGKGGTPPQEDKGMFAFFNGIKITGRNRRHYFKLLKCVFDGKYRLEHVIQCHCGSTDLELLSVQDRFGLPFGTKICRTCGLIQLSPRLSAECLSSFYDEIYWGLIIAESDKELATGDRYMGQKLYEYLEKHILEKFRNKPVTVIEIGCGSGVKLEEIKRLSKNNNFQVNVFGCDLSEDAVKMARRKNIEVHKGGVDALIGMKADIVILSHVVEHFVDIKAELEKTKKLLKEEAYLYIEVPGVCDLVNKDEYEYNYLIYSVMAHNYNFNLLSLRSVVEPLGFRFIAGDEYVRSIFCYDPSHISNVDVSRNYLHILQCMEQAEDKRKTEDRRRNSGIINKGKTLLSKSAKYVSAPRSSIKNLLDGRKGGTHDP